MRGETIKKNIPRYLMKVPWSAISSLTYTMVDLLHRRDTSRRWQPKIGWKGRKISQVTFMTDTTVIHIIVKKCISCDNGVLFLLCLNCSIFCDKMPDKAQDSKGKIICRNMDMGQNRYQENGGTWDEIIREH